MDKREFLRSTVIGFTGITSFDALEKLVSSIGHLPGDEVAGNEDFWQSIRGNYKLKPEYINLENGYYSILPQETLEKYIQHIRDVNYQGSFYMRTIQFENKKVMTEKLADLAGCSPEELIITRNTTESLDTVIGGLKWNVGDEAVMAHQDYGAMLDMFKLVEKRHGIVNKIISVPNHPQSDEEIVDLYSRAITRKTKVIMIGHMINITGQILPVRKICDMAHSKNVQVIVDGAHAFAQLKFSIPDLGCDYYAASLHKWLSVPLGAGILYVKKENISKLWPLFADSEQDENNIRRLNHTGTHPVHTDLAIADAIDYYSTIGAERKEARLRYLQNYWTSKVKAFPKVILNTPTDAARSCAIANVGIQGIKPADLANTLLDKYKVWTVAIDNDKANVHGCRITPNLYTTIQELDVFVGALKELGS